MKYLFTGKLWKWQGEGAWYFITLPEEYSDDLRSFVVHQRGFGSIKVTAQIGEQQWQTSIFPDKKSGSYLLPVKKEIRIAAGLYDGHMVSGTVTVHTD